MLETSLDMYSNCDPCIFIAGTSPPVTQNGMRFQGKCGECFYDEIETTEVPV